MTRDIFLLAAELKRQGEPFALVTVVRCQRPASARPGAKALIYGDGRLEGWVGGSCARPVVVREALRALALGTPRLIRLRGLGGPTNEDDENLVEYPMTCHSGGSLEIYVEPYLPAPRLVVVGQSPAARALVALGSFMGYAVTAVGLDLTAVDLPEAGRVARELGEVRAELDGRTALVVAGAGESDEQVLEEAIAEDLAYVALVASPRRWAAVRAELLDRGLSEAAVAKVKAPAGLDLGAVEPEEIALSIMAEIVHRRRAAAPGLSAAEVGSTAAPASAIDPICGMRVEIASARHVAEVGGAKAYFCCPACKRRFLEERT